MNELALFAGAGGGILGGSLLGWRTVCAVELNAYAAGVLVQRQNDGCLAPFPIWDDIRTFDGTDWQGCVDVVSGGFPCQDISAAGTGKGLEGERSGLWREMARVIRDVRPQFAFVENSPMLSIRGLDRVLADLAEGGYDAEWGVLGASDLGAPHIRKRIWILAYTKPEGLERLRRNAGQSQKPESWNSGSLADSPKLGRDSWRQSNSAQEQERGESNRSGVEADVSDTNGMRELQQEGREREQWRRPCDVRENIPDANSESLGWATESRGECSIWAVEPDVGRVVNGVAARVDRLKAIGNGQVPAVAARAWHVLCQRAAARK
jgi:DNA (cytosine-5)-methyltransferase 1